MEPVGYLGGINKVAWGAKLLPTSTSAHAMVGPIVAASVSY